ncbi:TIGR04283 family arsenosugar biosynthesis glycosyltransferase [Gloeothece verrucosa]|uniref:4,4'-diaponeurosporenoate glycosyltransferase n=1 Tax=Gloeothece verrucosa (strain PCC 7822) TaxID=497965 RepID=E0UN40_GLOV7|nr:TIGR04283 family arsenosugar biosynthesis glycosyltransferase [Gloeothece verrucosa]ADN18370.1 glycosyl transferase family 2 [Gloeothece verrucosa PCC 7822]
MPSVSIIIPTLNEATVIERTLRCLSILEPPALEIVVVDRGSSDETVNIAQKAGACVIRSSKSSRAIQMNTGASQAMGEYLCFLHADTLVMDDLVTLVNRTLAEPTVACAAFIPVIRGTTRIRWWFLLHSALKTYYIPLVFRPQLFFLKRFRLLFGDQTMFCRRVQFLACGGFNAELPIMEDADLCIKMLQFGKIRQINRFVETCDRRIAKWGFLKANVIYLGIGVLWGLGVPAIYLKKFYENVR